MLQHASFTFLFFSRSLFLFLRCWFCGVAGWRDHLCIGSSRPDQKEQKHKGSGYVTWLSSDHQTITHYRILPWSLLWFLVFPLRMDFGLWVLVVGHSSILLGLRVSLLSLRSFVMTGWIGDDSSMVVRLLCWLDCSASRNLVGAVLGCYGWDIPEYLRCVAVSHEQFIRWFWIRTF